MFFGKVKDFIPKVILKTYNLSSMLIFILISQMTSQRESNYLSEINRIFNGQNLSYQMDCGYTEGILGVSVSSRTLPGFFLPSCKSSCYFPICWFDQYWSWTPTRDTQGTYRTGTQPVTQTRCCLQQQVLLIGFSEGESALALMLTEPGGHWCRHTCTIFSRFKSKCSITDPLSTDMVSLYV